MKNTIVFLLFICHFSYSQTIEFLTKNDTLQKPKYQDLIEDLDYSLEKITGEVSPNTSVEIRRNFWSKVNVNNVVTKKI